MNILAIVIIAFLVSGSAFLGYIVWRLSNRNKALVDETMDLNKAVNELTGTVDDLQPYKDHPISANCKRMWLYVSTGTQKVWNRIFRKK